MVIQVSKRLNDMMQDLEKICNVFRKCSPFHWDPNHQTHRMTWATASLKSVSGSSIGLQPVGQMGRASYTLI